VNETIKKISLIIVLVLLPISWVYFQKKIDAKIGKDKKIENLVYIPSGRFLSVMTLGYRDVMADFLWMKTSIYFGSHFQTDKNYTWIYRLINSITDLDPSFDIPYVFGGIILANEVGNVEQSSDILFKGWKNIPNKWQFPFYIGFNNFFYDKNYKNAAKMIKAASELKGSPEYLKAMYIELLYKGNSPIVGKTFLAQSIKYIGNDDMKKELLQKIAKYEHKAVPDSIISNN